MMEKLPREHKCYACRHVGPSEEFSLGCPRCGSEDVFPHRKLRCTKCKQVYPVADILEEAELDVDPELLLVDKTLWEDDCHGCPTELKDETGDWWGPATCGNKEFELAD